MIKIFHRIGFAFLLTLLTFICVNTKCYAVSERPAPLPQKQMMKTLPSLVVAPQKKTTCFPVVKKNVEDLEEISTPWTPIKHEEVIVIDAGHGGDDYGTHSNHKPKYQEKYLNLATANLLKSYLEQLGYNTIMVRKNDIFIALDKRAEFANEQNPTLFVSVHYNSAPSKDAEGVEVYYYQNDENKKRVKQSKLLAEGILANVLKQTNAKSRGVKHGNFAVIRQTTMPAVLIEGGFLTNDDEMEKIKDPAYMKQIAWGIAKGINEYLEKRK